MSRAEELAEALQRVRARLSAACRAAGRDPREVTLVAVSKTWPASDIRLLADLGVAEFGENRDKEASGKAAELAAQGYRLRWHFVGSVQTNKAASVTAYADVVHSVDRQRLVAALSAAAVRHDRVVDALVQVSLDGEPGRGGAPPDEVPRLAAAVTEAPGLRLAGVMAVAPRPGSPTDSAAAFARLQEVAAAVRTAHPGADVLSAGMSADLEAAVAAGSTLVRVGTALFGHRGPVLG